MLIAHRTFSATVVSFGCSCLPQFRQCAAFVFIHVVFKPGVAVQTAVADGASRLLARYCRQVPSWLVSAGFHFVSVFGNRIDQLWGIGEAEIPADSADDEL